MHLSMYPFCTLLYKISIYLIAWKYIELFSCISAYQMANPDIFMLKSKSQQSYVSWWRLPGRIWFLVFWSFWRQQRTLIKTPFFHPHCQSLLGLTPYIPALWFTLCLSLSHMFHIVLTWLIQDISQSSLSSFVVVVVAILKMLYWFNKAKYL